MKLNWRAYSKAFKVKPKETTNYISQNVKIKIFNILAISLPVVLFSACSGDDANQNGRRGGGVMEADYVIVKPFGVSNELSLSGSLMPAESAMLSAQASGKVIEILFREGQKVEKGQILVRLDSREWLSQQNQLKAELATAEKDLERKLSLAEIQGVSAAAIDDARLKIATIQASKDEIDVQLDHATIRAPFAGTIGLRSISVGAYLAAGAPVAQLVKLNPLKLEFSVPEKYASEIAIGQSLSFTIAGSRDIYNGTVYATDPAISETTRALRVRAEVPNEKGLLIPGAFADITMSLDSISDGLMIPTDAIVPKLNEQLVYIFKNGEAHEVQVQTGIRKTATIQIVEGLSENDSVMVSGLLQVRNGMPIKPGHEMKIESLEN